MQPSKATLKPSSKTNPPFNLPTYGAARVDGTIEDDVPKTYEKYEVRYIAFIDILGFKEMIKKSGNTSNTEVKSQLPRLADALSINYQGFVRDYKEQSKKDDPDFRINTFSDFVVVSAAASHVGLEILLFVVARIAQDWLSKGYLCRGGISKGQVIHRGNGADDKPMVFGPAFVSAYMLEQEVADYPRIILSKEVRKDYESFKKDSSDFSKDFYKLVTKCDDGPLCIDFFAHLRKNGFDFLGKDQLEEAKQFHDTLVHELEHGSDHPKWYRKTAWLVAMFNKAIDKTRYADRTIDQHRS